MWRLRATPLTHKKDTTVDTSRHTTARSLSLSLSPLFSLLSQLWWQTERPSLCAQRQSSRVLDMASTCDQLSPSSSTNEVVAFHCRDVAGETTLRYACQEEIWKSMSSRGSRQLGLCSACFMMFLTIFSSPRWSERVENVVGQARE